MNDLPPYNETGTCPKCGHPDIATTYKAANEPGGWDGTHHRTPARPERLQRTSYRCRYRWDEATLTTSP